MPREFSCPSCQSSISTFMRVSEKMRCPHCNTTTVVPPGAISTPRKPPTLQFPPAAPVDSGEYVLLTSALVWLKTSYARLVHRRFAGLKVLALYATWFVASEIVFVRLGHKVDVPDALATLWFFVHMVGNPLLAIAIAVYSAVYLAHAKRALLRWGVLAGALTFLSFAYLAFTFNGPYMSRLGIQVIAPEYRRLLRGAGQPMRFQHVDPREVLGPQAVRTLLQSDSLSSYRISPPAAHPSAKATAGSIGWYPILQSGPQLTNAQRATAVGLLLRCDLSIMRSDLRYRNVFSPKIALVFSHEPPRIACLIDTRNGMVQISVANNTASQWQRAGSFTIPGRAREFAALAQALFPAATNFCPPQTPTSR